MGSSQSHKITPHFSLFAGEYSSVGKRKYNEDHLIVKIDLAPKGKKKLDENPSIFAVCDGHSGARCSQYLRSSLPDFIRSHEKYGEGDWEEVLLDSFKRCDEKFLKNAKKKVCFHGGEEGGGSLFIFLLSHLPFFDFFFLMITLENQRWFYLRVGGHPRH